MKSRPKETRALMGNDGRFRVSSLIGLFLFLLLTGCFSRYESRALVEGARKGTYPHQIPLGPEDDTAILNLRSNRYKLDAKSLMKLVQRNPRRIRNFCQLHAIHRLGQLKVQEAVPLILPFYNDGESQRLRLEVAFALSRLGFWPTDSILVQVSAPPDYPTHLYNAMAYAAYLSDYRAYPLLDSLLALDDSLSLYDLNEQYRAIANYATYYGKPDQHGLYVDALPAFQERYQKGGTHQMGLLRCLMHSTPPLPAELLAIVGEGRDTITDENLRWHVDSVLRMR